MSEFQHHTDNESVIDVLKKTIIAVESGKCPHISVMTRDSEEVLFGLACCNKALGVLFHFSDCSWCTARISTAFKKILIRAKFQTSLDCRNKAIEQAKLLRCLKRQNLDAVFYKTCPTPPGFPSRESVSSDIDILVSQADRDKLIVLYKKQGYRMVRYEPKEHTLVQPATNIRIDIHTLVAYPHFGGLSDQSLSLIRRISEEMKRHTGFQKETGLRVLQTHFYVIFLALNFWYNDIGFGMHTLYQLVASTERIKKKDADRIKKIFHIRGWYTLFCFIIHAGYRFYARPVPQVVRTAFPLRLSDSLFLRFFVNRFIVNRHSIDAWHTPPNAWAHKRFYDFRSLDLLLRDTTLPLQFFRLGALRFIVRAAIWR